MYKNENPLLIPILLGWDRCIIKLRSGVKREVSYRAPCGRQLRSLDEIYLYLCITKCPLGIDHFCFDFWVKIFAQFKPTNLKIEIPDISYGKENLPVSCINSIDECFPIYTEYCTERLPANDVHLNLDSEFLPGCDCEDDCRDQNKCSCWQLTLQSYANSNTTTHRTTRIGYEHRRLKEAVISGIYECYSRCKCCVRTCINRVVQHPLQTRLQLFKTHHKGWGLRTIDDIPQGAFICVYAGQLLTEHGANEDGKTFGDEYLAELDYIEVAEKYKEGYESDIYDDEMIGNNVNPPLIYDSEEDHCKSIESDEEFVPGINSKDNLAAVWTRTKKQDRSESKQSGQFLKELSASNNYMTENKNFKKESVSTRELFGKGECCYIMDAKSIGNIGRYLNHSCNPNVFVQNVFVDTHDVRFPWVAFFALTYIRAGTELTWDYSYEVGSVPHKVLYCYCGTTVCRGRLL